MKSANQTKKLFLKHGLRIRDDEFIAIKMNCISLTRYVGSVYLTVHEQCHFYLHNHNCAVFSNAQHNDDLIKN
jgi:hypothetical protein